MKTKSRIWISLLMIPGIIIIFFYGCENENINLCKPTIGETTAIFNPGKDYGTVTDQNGNVYKTIIIGTQTWMAENLRATCYRNGDPISEITDSLTWINLSSGGYCNYNNTNSIDTIVTYGRLYNWFAVDDDRNIAPEGWHVPSLDEWFILENYLGNDTIAANKLKETSSTHWKKSWYQIVTNESGFTALPGGYRPKGFYEIGSHGFWWTSSEGDTYDDRAWHQDLCSCSEWVGGCECSKIYGKSIRCVKD